jgi:hypothetical protein
VSPQDPIDRWAAERRRAPAPGGFADRVMAAVRERRVSSVRGGRPAPARAISFLTMAAAVCAAFACHAVLAGAVLLAWAGSAR